VLGGESVPLQRKGSEREWLEPLKRHSCSSFGRVTSADDSARSRLLRGRAVHRVGAATVCLELDPGYMV
jgi:hypothetical protein